MQSIHFTALRMLSESEVEITFEGDDGTPVVHVFTVNPFSGIAGVLITNSDHEFWAKYRHPTSPITPRWPEELAAAAYRAAQESFPAGETLKLLMDEIRAERLAAWKAARPDAGEPDRN